MTAKARVVGENTTTTAFSYDALDRTESIGNNTFAYDCDGNRIVKSTDNTTTETVWNNGEISADLIGDSVKVFTEDNSVYCENGEFTFNAIDSKGDVVATTSSYYGDYTYDAWGNDLYNTNTTNPIGYRGYYFDSETGLYYLKARYYDSTTGQFTQEDTVQDDNLQYNLYGYCSGNPIRFVDPSGHFKVTGITLPSWKKESKNIANQLRKKFYPGSQWGIYSVKNNEQFKRVWNNMPKPNILFINSHGSKTSICGEGSSSSFNISTTDVSSLKHRNIKLLVLMGCNTGHWSGGMENIAIAFLKKISGVVLASDGTVSSYKYEYDDPKKNTYKYTSKGDKHWKKQCINKTDRKKGNKGWVVYHRKKEKVYGRILGLKGEHTITQIVKQVRRQKLF